MPAKISATIRQRAARVKLFLCDVDGVLTDGSIFIGGERELKRFNIQDGLGIILLRRSGIKTGWVSARPSLATELRAKELKIDFLVQQNDKQSKTGAIEHLLTQEKLDWPDICFVGDDIVDLGPLKRAGLAVAVANGIAEVKTAAHFTTQARGGEGAIREVVEMILKAQGKWTSFVAHYSE
ncbi:MAG TPA: HAD hydrolase family protein [Verrucomicrobiae bacterium]|nr:HAD hydrolase family protein [Verrucomicrobiae bacterium]